MRLSWLLSATLAFLAIGFGRVALGSTPLSCRVLFADSGASPPDRLLSEFMALSHRDLLQMHFGELRFDQGTTTSVEPFKFNGSEVVGDSRWIHVRPKSNRQWASYLSRIKIGEVVVDPQGDVRMPLWILGASLAKVLGIEVTGANSLRLAIAAQTSDQIADFNQYLNSRGIQPIPGGFREPLKGAKDQDVERLERYLSDVADEGIQPMENPNRAFHHFVHDKAFHSLFPTLPPILIERTQILLRKELAFFRFSRRFFESRLDQYEARLASRALIREMAFRFDVFSAKSLQYGARRLFDPKEPHLPLIPGYYRGVSTTVSVVGTGGRLHLLSPLDELAYLDINRFWGEPTHSVGQIFNPESTTQLSNLPRIVSKIEQRRGLPANTRLTGNRDLERPQRPSPSVYLFGEALERGLPRTLLTSPSIWRQALEQYLATHSEPSRRSALYEPLVRSHEEMIELARLVENRRQELRDAAEDYMRVSTWTENQQAAKP